MSQQLVQASHAAHEVANQFPCRYPDVSSLVLIGVADEPALLEEARLLTERGINHHLFTEPDLNGAATALATIPITGDLRRHFRRHALWRPKDTT